MREDRVDISQRTKQASKLTNPPPNHPTRRTRRIQAILWLKNHVRTHKQKTMTIRRVNKRHNFLTKLRPSERGVAMQMSTNNTPMTRVRDKIDSNDPTGQVSCASIQSQQDSYHASKKPPAAQGELAKTESAIRQPEGRSFSGEC